MYFGEGTQSTFEHAAPTELTMRLTRSAINVALLRS